MISLSTKFPSNVSERVNNFICTITKHFAFYYGMESPNEHKFKITPRYFKLITKIKTKLEQY